MAYFCGLEALESDAVEEDAMYVVPRGPQLADYASYIEYVRARDEWWTKIWRVWNPET
jgi:hypothetical protein